MCGLFLGVPVKLGRGGLEKIIEVELTSKERADLGKSAEAVREPMSKLSILISDVRTYRMTAPSAAASHESPARATAVMRFWNSSIGKKAVMAVTGLGMIGFVIVHMAGNLQMFAGPLKINEYAAAFRRLGPLLWVARRRVARRARSSRHRGVSAHAKNTAGPPRRLRTIDEPQVSTFAARTHSMGRGACCWCSSCSTSCISRSARFTRRSMPRTSTATSSRLFRSGGSRCCTSSR